MIGAKTMIRSLGGRLFTMCAVSMSVAVVTISLSLSAPDFGAADALMLRLMSTYNVSGAALALIKDGGIVMEKGYGYRDRETGAPMGRVNLPEIASLRSL
jgi:CubicO group peptidase (beta-lactamase class C family)